MRLLDLDLSGGRSQFTVLIRDRKTGSAAVIDNLSMPMPGQHNALNATAAIAVAHTLGVPAETIVKALGAFGGVKRRFTKTGEWNGALIYDDYGHHPVEIAAVLKAARASTKNQVIAVMQPHRYTRLSSLFNDFAGCFNDADTIIVAPVYAAGEAPIEGASRDDLIAGIKARGHRHVLTLEDEGELAPFIRDLAKPGDYVVCLGAGTITNWAYALPGELAALDAVPPKQVLSKQSRPHERAGRAAELHRHHACVEADDARTARQAVSKSGHGWTHLVPRRRSGAGDVFAG